MQLPQPKFMQLVKEQTRTEEILQLLTELKANNADNLKWKKEEITYYTANLNRVKTKIKNRLQQFKINVVAYLPQVKSPAAAMPVFY